MSNKDIIEVVQAHIDGKRIQIRKMGSHQGFRDGKWYDVENPRWDFDSCDYRVSPESTPATVVIKQCEKCGTFAPPKPREWVVGVFKDALYMEKTLVGEVPRIRVREVIE